ncbi:MAG TPA: AAA family ATPase [Roseiarcus sp.]
MRLLSLEMEKFGAFADLRIAFRPDARLHVVYGPNEAGKSTALAAVGALLFGVPERTPYASGLPGQLRVGGEIVAADGRSLKFWRRKGRKNTLLGGAGSPLPDDALAPFLGGLTQDVFERSFGLDANRLRAGGEEMLRADGDVGASLMAAASGLRGLAELRRSLDNEADGVFALRSGKDRQFYQALERFTAARAAIREKELRSDSWIKLNNDIEELSRELERLRAERRAGEIEQARLRRFKRVSPLLNPIQETEAALASFDDMPLFAPGMMQDLQAALDQLRVAGEGAERARIEAERLARDLATIEVDEAVLSDAAAIEELFQRSGGYKDAKRDLPAVQREADGFLAGLEHHVRSLGLPGLGSLETARPTEARKSEARRLIKEGRDAEASARAKAAQLAQAQKFHDEARIAREAEGVDLDPAPLRERYAALGKISELARRVADNRIALTKETLELADAAARLDPPVADLEALAGLPRPRSEDLVHFLEAFEANSRVSREAAGAREAVEKGIEETTGRLAQLAAGRPLATADRIAEARARRETAWRPLRAAIVGTPEVPPQASLVTHVAEFERVIREADRLMDDAIEDAARLAEHRLETQRLDEQTRRYALAQAAEARAAASLAETEQRWQELWRHVRIRPLSPARMQEWSGRIEQFMKTRDKLASRRIELEAQEAELARLEPALRALGLEAGLSEIEGLDCIRLAERFERRLEDVTRAWEKSRELEMRLTEGRRRLGAAKTEDAAAGALLEDWRRRWVEAVVALGLEAHASLDGAETALQVWDKASDDGENHRKGLRRVVGIQRNMSDFETEARALVMRCVPAAADLPADVAARLLNARLVATRTAQTKRHAVAERSEAARRAVDEALALLGKAGETMAQQAARLPPGADVAALLAREAERSHLAEALGRQRLRLADLADGVDEARLVEEMNAFDPDAATAILKELERRDEDLGQQEKDRYTERDRLQRRREEFESGIGAEAALQQRRNAETELVDAARRWAVLKAASVLLGGALEHHRAALRDPLMTRAGEVFATLTGGAFAGLDQSFYDDDEAKLEACRANGERATVAHLSEGARDQMYLALRLAYIEDYAARAEAPPFIGDDIFASFDESRTGNGLEALAAIGDRIQPIVFTHHLHVIEEARARLGDAADIVRIR